MHLRWYVTCNSTAHDALVLAAAARGFGLYGSRAATRRNDSDASEERAGKGRGSAERSDERHGDLDRDVVRGHRGRACLEG